MNRVSLFMFAAFFAASMVFPGCSKNVYDEILATKTIPTDAEPEIEIETVRKDTGFPLTIQWNDGTVSTLTVTCISTKQEDGNN